MYNLRREYKDFPAIYAQSIEEDENHFGCTAGGIDRFYINAKGDVQPCEFLNISFGNVQDENFEDIYDKNEECILQCRRKTDVREIIKKYFRCVQKE